MKVSIVTVCYNSAATIRDTIESVLAQTYSDIEYIVVDGASQDSTMNIVREYKDHIDLVLSEPDQGIYDAMNKGISMATGEVVGILNSDDFLTSPSSIESIISAFSEKDTDAVYGDLVYVDAAQTDKITRYYSVNGLSKRKLRLGIMIPHPTFYAKRKLFPQHGYYKTDYCVSADFELMARFWLAGANFRKVNSVVVSMREGGISSSGLKWRIRQNKEIVRACQENGIYTNIGIVGLKIPFKLMSKIKSVPRQTGNCRD